MGHPSDVALGKMLESGAIKDCHLAPRDLRVARELFPTSLLPPHGTHWSADIFFVKKAGGRKRPLLLLTEEKTGLDVLYVLNSRSTREIHQAGKKFQHGKNTGQLFYVKLDVSVTLLTICQLLILLLHGLKL